MLNVTLVLSNFLSSHQWSSGLCSLLIVEGLKALSLMLADAIRGRRELSIQARYIAEVQNLLK